MPNESVTTRAQLVDRLASLAQSVRTGNMEVENTTTADFLEAAAAWLNDCDGFYMARGVSVPGQPTWSMIADTFEAALNYE